MSTNSLPLDDELNKNRRLFARYLIGILLNLVVLGLFAEHWSYVQIGSFSVTLLTAVVLQLLMKLTIKAEHQIADHFQSKSGTGAKLMRAFFTWLILFGSKFVMLGVLGLLFGDKVVFEGPMNGVVSFVAVVVAMLAAEQAVVRIYRSMRE